MNAIHELGQLLISEIAKNAFKRLKSGQIDQCWVNYLFLGKNKFFDFLVKYFFDFLVLCMAKVKMAYFHLNASKKMNNFFGHLEWSRVQ
jgi:hypothetical protein